MNHAIKFLLVLLAAARIAPAQDCASDGNIVPFTLLGVDYEIVKENLDWAAAAACAVERGGRLAEAGSQDEQDGLFAQLGLADIQPGLTVAPDGGGASYVWIGGCDLVVEGDWIWDGDDDGAGPQFWEGTASGEPVDGLYSNWGNEPDNWNDQDGLGLAITDWPLGVAGQWNDVDAGNDLYYIVEYPLAGVGADGAEPGRARRPVLGPPAPNPFNPTVRVEYELPRSADVTLAVSDLLGRRVALLDAGRKAAGRHAAVIAGDGWPSGLYFVTLEAAGSVETRKILLMK